MTTGLSVTVHRVTFLSSSLLELEAGKQARKKACINRSMHPATHAKPLCPFPKSCWHPRKSCMVGHASIHMLYAATKPTSVFPGSPSSDGVMTRVGATTLWLSRRHLRNVLSEILARVQGPASSTWVWLADPQERLFLLSCCVPYRDTPTGTT